MNDFEDAKKKTSRRRFAKTAASALVAMPVISSLSSCAQKQPTPPSPPGSPSPQPSPSGSPRIGVERGSNPPIIIDGGSLSILTVPEFDTTSPPAPFKYTPKDDAYKVISGVIVISDDGQPLVSYALATNEVLEVSVWIGTVVKNGNEYDYDPVDVATPPDMKITAGKTLTNPLTIVTDEEIKSPKRSPKKKNPPKYLQYLNEKWKTKGNKEFRIAAVEAKVGVQLLLRAAESDYGFKIVFVVS